MAQPSFTAILLHNNSKLGATQVAPHGERRGVAPEQVRASGYDHAHSQYYVFGMPGIIPQDSRAYAPGRWSSAFSSASCGLTFSRSCRAVSFRRAIKAWISISR